MFLRDEAKFKKSQEHHVKVLTEEAVQGVTQRDVLPNTAQPLQGEVEAMYFSDINHFFENSISRKVMKHTQDLYEGK